jgi:hypothetical protein
MMKKMARDENPAKPKNLICASGSAPGSRKTLIESQQSQNAIMAMGF